MNRTIVLVATVAILAACILATFVSCGHKGNRSDMNVGAPLAAPSQGRASTAPTIPLAAVLRDIDATPVPKGVSAGLWAMLKTELKRLLIARAGGSKTISSAPTGLANAVSDLAAVSNPAGTLATVTWTEKLAGDYNNDGVVDITDLQPLALYYMLRTDTGPDDAHRLVNGDADPEINIADLGAIAQNYMAHLQGYQVWRGHWNGVSTDWDATPRTNPNVANPNWSADRSSPSSIGSRPTYVYQDDLTGITDTANVRYKVTAYGDGAAGAESNVATLLPYPLANSPWPKFRGNAQNTGRSPYVGAQTNHVKWTYTTGASIGSASPSIAPDGTVYIASSDGYFYALNPSDGSLKWKAQTGGGNSSPAVGADGTVYIGGSDGKLHAINPIDGSFKWQVSLTSTHVESSPAIGGDGTIYVGCDVSMSGTDMFFALNPADGSFNWKRPLGSSIVSSPAIGLDGTIYVGSNDHNLYALDRRDGSTKWFFTTGDLVSSSPAIGADGTVYIGSNGDEKVYALRPQDGTLKWTLATGGYVTNSPAVAVDGTIYVACILVTSGFAVVAIESQTGTTKWSFPSGSAGPSSATVGLDGKLYVGAGYLYALTPSGAELWHFYASGPVYSSPAIGTDGTLYFGGGFNPYVYAIGP